MPGVEHNNQGWLEWMQLHQEHMNALQIQLAQQMQQQMAPMIAVPVPGGPAPVVPAPALPPDIDPGWNNLAAPIAPFADDVVLALDEDHDEEDFADAHDEDDHDDDDEADEAMPEPMPVGGDDLPEVILPNPDAPKLGPACKLHKKDPETGTRPCSICSKYKEDKDLVTTADKMKVCPTCLSRYATCGTCEWKCPPDLFQAKVWLKEYCPGCGSKGKLNVKHRKEFVSQSRILERRRNTWPGQTSA